MVTRGGLRGAAVLAYHAIGDVDPALDVHGLFTPVAAFRRQMEWLARSFRVVPLSDVVSGRAAGPRTVALTFDDGYRSVLEHGVPVLERLGLPATMFVPTAYLGDENRWNPPTGLDLTILAPDELRELERRGVAVESHGHAHIDMRRAGEDEVRADLLASQAILADVVGRRPTLLAWPFRTATPGAQRIAADLGFDVAFSIDLPDAGRLAWPRPQVTPRDGMPLFALKCTGSYLGVRHAPVLDAGYRRLVKPLLRRRPPAAAAGRGADG